MSAVIDDLKTDIAAQGTVIGSAVTFINGVPALVAEAVRKALEEANVDTAEIEAAVTEADAIIEAQTAELKAALVSGTGETLPAE